MHFSKTRSPDSTYLKLAAGAPLEDLLLWLCAYEDLFTRRCAATGTLLAADAASQHFFPPLLRPFGLRRPQLIEAARRGGGGVRQAFHPHAAPLTVLQPQEAMVAES